MSGYKVLRIKGYPYQVNDSTWVVDVFVKSANGVESTHVFCKSCLDALKVKSGDFL